MKKKLYVVISILFILLLFFLWGKILGECPFGMHIVFKHASCTENEACFVCGKTLAKATGHELTEATCISPETCKKCEETFGEPLGHSWVEATCEQPKTCSRCGKTDGVSLGHNYNKNGICTRCKGATYGIWKKDYYVDKFGDKTTKVYITSDFSGTFSNSATTKSKLTGYWLIDVDKTCIVLFEYGSMRVKGSSRNISYNVSIKDNSGKYYYTTLYLDEGEDRLRFKSPKTVYDALEGGGKVSFYIERTDRAVEQYSFTIPDATGYKNLWGSLWKWSD